MGLKNYELDVDENVMKAPCKCRFSAYPMLRKELVSF